MSWSINTSRSLRINAIFGTLVVLCGLIFPATLGPQPITAKASQAGVVVAAGGSDNEAFSHTCLLENGAVACVGSNNHGQLGNGTTTDSSTLQEVVGLSAGVTSIKLGEEHSCAIVNGDVWCWGNNTYGQLGDGTTNSSSTPVSVGLSGVTSIQVGGYHSCATFTTLQASGVKCWGYNEFGQLGNGVNLSDGSRPLFSSQPVTVSNIDVAVSELALGYEFSCALIAGGVKCWGGNLFGYLGKGDSGAGTYSSIPVDVQMTGSNVTSIAAGAWTTCALTSSGAVKCWGWGAEGAVGDGNGAEINLLPVLVFGLESGVTAIDVGNYHACAILVSTAIKCWGYNLLGQLGASTPMPDEDSTPLSLTPINVPNVSGVLALSLGSYHTCARTNNNVQCWGDNSDNQLVNKVISSSSSSGSGEGGSSSSGGLSQVSAPALVQEQAKTKMKLFKKEEAVATFRTNGAPVLVGSSASKPIGFSSGKAKLDTSDLKMIQAVAKKYAGEKGSLVVVGFTERSSLSSRAAKKLSLSRARVVSAALAQAGGFESLRYLGFGVRNKLKPTSSDNRVAIRWIPATGTSSAQLESNEN